MRGGSFMQYAKNIYSQNGEDGIIHEVLQRLGVRVSGTGYFVEFGTGNGRDLSNSLVLAERGWHGLWIEQNEESFKKTEALAATFGDRVRAMPGTVGFEGSPGDGLLDEYLDRARAPMVLDFMSIDIDSHDYEVWRDCVRHRAMVVLIEINSGVPLGVRQTHGNGKQGTSFTSMLELGRSKGYRLVAHTGNLLFVAEEVADRLGQPEAEKQNPNLIFNDMWARWAAQSK